MDFEPIEPYLKMSSQAIQRRQEEKLRTFITQQLYPFSPYYHKLFDDKGIDPASIRTIKDLEKLPLTKKEDIMPTPENPKRFKDFILQPDVEKIKKAWPKGKLIGMKLREMMGADLKEDLRLEYYPTFMIATSGTTGNNVPFLYSHRDVEMFSNAYYAVKDVVDINEEWAFLNVFPFAPHLAFTYVYWINVTGKFRVMHTGGGAITSTTKTLDVIQQIDAQVIIGIPSYVYHLLSKAIETDRKFPRIKRVITAGEKLAFGTRKRMEEMLRQLGAKGARIYDVYGTTEMRDAFAECAPGSQTFHIHPNIHIFEIVDPKTGKQKKPGEGGAVAVTNIDGRGSVLCRFLIGDIFEGGIKYGKCPNCGSEVPRLCGPIGRIRDYSRELNLTKVKGTLLNLNSFFEIMPNLPGVDEWQVSIEKRNNDPHDMDVLKVNVAVKKGFEAEKVKSEVSNKISDAIEITPIVDTHFTSDELFEMMGGQIKPKRIVDNRAQAGSKDESAAKPPAKKEKEK